MILDDGIVRIDATDFEKGLQKVIAQVDNEAIGPGLFMMGNAVLKDAIYVAPQAPMLHGDLRGMARVQTTDGVLRKTTDSPPTKKKANTAVDEIKIGFNIVYAAKWHEAVGKKINWTRDFAKNPGPKYLEMKLRMFPKRYLKIMSEYVKKALHK